MVCDAASVKYFVASHAFHVKNKKQREQELVCCHLSGQEHLLALRMHNVSATISGTFVVLGRLMRCWTTPKKRGTACQTNARTSRTKAVSKAANRAAVNRADSRTRRTSPVRAVSRAGKAASVRAASRTARPSRNSFPGSFKGMASAHCAGAIFVFHRIGRSVPTCDSGSPSRGRRTSPLGKNDVRSTKVVRRAPRKQLQLSVTSCLESE